MVVQLNSKSDVPEHIRLEGRYLTQEDAFVYWDIHLLQVFVWGYAVELTRRMLGLVQSSFLLQLMKCSHTMPHCYLLVSLSFCWTRNQLSFVPSCYYSIT
ncbi:unnamed protein product [Lathyrus oleraceus]